MYALYSIYKTTYGIILITNMVIKRIPASMISAAQFVNMIILTIKIVMNRALVKTMK